MDYVFTNNDGSEIDFSELRGKKVAILVWGSWAEPAKETIKSLNEMYDELVQNNVEIYSVSPTDEEEFIKENNIKITNSVDYESEFINWLGSDTMPFIHVYEEDGNKVNEIV